MLSLFKLVQNSVDYAGLFPPAGLPLSEVAQNYHSYFASLARPMLGRLVIPATQLEDLARITSELGTDSDSKWFISALLPPWDVDQAKFANATKAINGLNNAQSKLCVDAIETKVESSANVNSIIGGLPENVTGFLEVGLDSDPTPTLERIAFEKAASNSNVFAKVRTGSVVADQIPDVQTVAKFIGACSRIPLGFKATAGLHHPMRAEHRLTCEENPLRSTMHGFLNVFAATVFAFEHQLPDQVIKKILSDQSAGNFTFDDDVMKWGDWSVSAERVSHWREQGILSFGSCSFDEPSEELQALGYQNLFTSKSK